MRLGIQLHAVYDTNRTIHDSGAHMTFPRIVVQNGTIFTGDGSPPIRGTVEVEDGKVKRVGPFVADAGPADLVIDAAGKWVMPGFLDIHTHYDAEVELAPALSESLRHGVTTVFIGSCSLSTAVGDPVDIADMFARVEAIPRDLLLDLFSSAKTWETPQEYADHLNSLPLGPNVAALMGHSAMRASVLGLERALTPKVSPSSDEMKRMDAILVDALRAGYLGLSYNSLSWDKMDGPRFRSRTLPSTYARFKEYRHFNKTLRTWGRVLQAVPNVSTKYEVLAYGLMSAGWFRPKLKSTIVALMDLRDDRKVHRLVKIVTTLLNKVFGADLRLQALPNVFDLWADGIDLVVFEEFQAGAMALHLADEAERRALLQEDSYRAKFRNQWRNPFIPRAFHRNFRYSEIKDCPDRALVGKSFHDIAMAQGRSVTDVFLDLVVRFGRKLRWYTVMANDRPDIVGDNIRFPGSLIGFSDAGAHLRNMAHYNFPLRTLRLVKESQGWDRPIMPLETAVWRLTGELADWFGIDAGHLRSGAQADLVVVNPEGLDDSLDAFEEVAYPRYPEYKRLVRRNDRAVDAVVVRGRLAVRNGIPLPEVGTVGGFGRFLAAKT